MERLIKYFVATFGVVIVVFSTWSCSKSPEEQEQLYEFPVSISASAESGCQNDDLICLTLNSNNNPGSSGCYGIAQYKYEDGKIVRNGDQLFVYRGTYYVMFSGVRASDGNSYTAVPEPKPRESSKCYVYDVHRKGVDENNKEDLFIDISTIEYLSFYGDYLSYIVNGTSSGLKASLDANVELKKQYSKMKFTLKSNKYNDSSPTNDTETTSGGHSIQEIKLENLIKKAEICPTHGLHLDVDTDMEHNAIELSYGSDDTDGSVFVTAKKNLTVLDGAGDNDGYVSILSGGYAEVNSQTLLPILPSPTLSVTYTPGEGAEPLINKLPIMINLEPQTRYQFDVTLTNVQLNVTISEISGWDEGDDQDHTITEITSYSVDLTNDKWDEDHDITGTVD